MRLRASPALKGLRNIALSDYFERPEEFIALHVNRLNLRLMGPTH